MVGNDVSNRQSVKTMLRIFLILLCFILLKSTQAASKILQRDDQSPVTGAVRCSIEDYPFVVSIRRIPSHDHICGGTLILPSWVLTSTSCLTGFTHKDILVTAGSECLTPKLSQKDQNNSATAVKIVTHPHQAEDNIALIKLKTLLKESSKVNFVKLANYLTSLDDLFFRKCLNSTILGWGYGSNTTNKIRNSSRYTDLPQCLYCINFSLQSRCAKKEFWDSKSISCADQNANEYCQGDSGGPLMCNAVQIGIVKIGCSNAGTLSFYTRIDSYNEFIYKVVSAGSHFYFNFPYFVIIVILIK